MEVDGLVVLAEPALAGDGLRWVIVGVIVLGLVIAWLLAANVRRSHSELPPPITRARLLPPEDEDDTYPDDPPRN